MEVQITPSDGHLTDVRRTAAAIFREQKIRLTGGHFKLERGYHSSEYFNPHAILDAPSVLWQLAQLLLDVISSSVKDEVEVVCGPETGGAHLGHILAGLLDGRRELTRPKMQFAPIHKTNGGMSLRKHYRAIVADKRILLVDDVIRTGQTISNCAQEIEAADGRIIAVAALLQRSMRVIVDRQLEAAKVPTFVLQTFETSDYPKGQCPLCANGIALTEF